MTDPDKMTAAVACARMLSSAEAVIREAERLREDRDKLLRVIRGEADGREESRHA